MRVFSWQLRQLAWCQVAGLYVDVSFGVVCVCVRVCVCMCVSVLVVVDHPVLLELYWTTFFSFQLAYSCAVVMPSNY